MNGTHTIMRPRSYTLQIAAVGFLLTAWGPSALAQECQPSDLRLLTGREGGYYDKVGKAIEQVARKNQVNICAQSVLQTLLNIRELQENKAAFALVQSDLAHAAWYGHTNLLPQQSFPQDFSRVKLVMPLYIEAVHILVRPHLTLSSLADLRGKKVWLGPNKSGTEFAAKRILSAAGLRKEELEQLQSTVLVPGEDFCKAVQMLKPDSLDALFRVSVLPTDEIEHALKKDTEKKKEGHACEKATEIQLFELDYGFVDRLVKDGSYIETLISSKWYDQDRASLTVGVQALLLTSRDDGDAAVTKLARILRSNRADIEQRIKVMVREEQIKHSEKATGIPSELSLLGVPTRERLYAFAHPGAKTYLYDSWRDSWKRFLPIIGCLVLGLVAFFYWKRVEVGEWLVRLPGLALALGGTLVIWFVGACVLNHFEGRVNEHFSALSRSLEFTFLYLTPLSGYEPLTRDGQSAIKITSWASLLLFGGFVTPLIRQGVRALSPRLASWMLGRRPLPKDLNNHILMLNRSARAEDIIKELRARDRDSECQIVVVAERAADLPPTKEYRHVYFLVGDPTDKDCLKDARAVQARSVTILSAWRPPDPQDRRRWLRGDQADSKTIHAIRLIQGLCAEQNPGRTVPITAEIRTKQYADEAVKAGGEQTRVVFV